MPDDHQDLPRTQTADALQLIRAAERGLLEGPNELSPEQAAAIRSALARVEAATPRGPALHAQLGSVRKWLGVLERPEDHDRFGGASHLRDYLVTQLRLAGGALEDYLREMT